MLFILMVTNCFNAVDRSIINILIEPIRHDLNLSDTQIGLITGLGYALCYVGFSIPVARWVDRYNRVYVLAGGLAVWSLMTALTGRASGFASLLLARAAVGASESTCYPAAFSLIGDYFEKPKRPRAIALFQLGTYGGIIFGAMAAGLIAARFGWRGAFGILGFPGMGLALLAILTVREPARGMSDGDSKVPGRAAGGLGAMTRLLRSDTAFARLICAAVLMAVAQIIMGSWVPAFMMRVHGLSQLQVGVLAAPVIGLGGVAGTVVGGIAGTWLARRRKEERAPLLVMLTTAPFAIPALLVFLFADPLQVTLVGGALTAFLISLHFGPLVAVCIGRVDSAKRGIASAILVVGQFLLGFGLGPLIVGAISDRLASADGADSLRYAMLVAPVSVLLACLLAAGAYRRLGA